jgi:hypothetical protein
MWECRDKKKNRTLKDRAILKMYTKLLNHDLLSFFCVFFPIFIILPYILI